MSIHTLCRADVLKVAPCGASQAAELVKELLKQRSTLPEDVATNLVKALQSLEDLSFLAAGKLPKQRIEPQPLGINDDGDASQHNARSQADQSAPTPGPEKHTDHLKQDSSHSKKRKKEEGEEEADKKASSSGTKEAKASANAEAGTSSKKRKAQDSSEVVEAGAGKSKEKKKKRDK